MNLETKIQQPTTILVVDASATDRAAFMGALAPLGFPIVACASGEEALTRIPECRPWLIVLDLTVTDCDGFELLRRVHDLAPEAVIFVTHPNPKEEEVFRAHQQPGCECFLIKPIELEGVTRFAGRLLQSQVT